MKFALGQSNPRIGDFSANSSALISLAQQALKGGADILVTPELSLCGYPPMDLLEQPAFVQQNIRALRNLQKNLPRDIGVLVGSVDVSTETAGKGLQNVMNLIYQGKIIHRQAKTLLPTYDVFDEARYFAPATTWNPVDFQGIRLGIAICEDMWWETEASAGVRYGVDPVKNLIDQGTDVLIVPSASPYYPGKPETRLHLMQHIGRSNGVPVVYVNTVGANDNLIFDGNSLVTDARGSLIHQSPGFISSLEVVDLPDLLDLPDFPASKITGSTAHTPGISGPSTQESPTKTVSNPISLNSHEYRDIADALALGIRDYLAKSGFSQVHLGLSGGIDSAVVAALAVRALGPDKVTGFMMPSQYSSPGSLSDSVELAQNLGIRVETLGIEPVYRSFESVLAPQFAGRQPDLAEENIQARIRGTLLMAYSNKFGSLVLTTGNKSELAVGYSTLYGDMAGSLAVIGDLFKTQVYALARYLNESGPLIPQAIIDKAPSAELRPDQKDQDSLPEYDLLDSILEQYLLYQRTSGELVAQGFDAQVVQKVLSLVAKSEYKRRQAPPVLKVSPRAFGTGRRIPIARAFSELG